MRLKCQLGSFMKERLEYGGNNKTKKLIRRELAWKRERMRERERVRGQEGVFKKEKQCIMRYIVEIW